MKIAHTRRAVSLFLVSLLFPAFLQFAPVKSRTHAASAVKTAEVIKVGITEYQKVEDSYDRYEELFRQLTDAADIDEPVTFSFAIGNYAEVLDWYNNGLIDVAILSAMPVADLLNAAGPDELKKINEAYVGDVSVSRYRPPSDGKILNLFPVQRVDPFRYRTGCMVLDSDKEIGNIEDIKRLWKQNQVNFLFVRPYSMSGYILPMSVLHKHGIYPEPGQFKFTYEHGKSLAEMSKRLQDQNAPDKRHLVAFVLDATSYEPSRGAPSQIFRRVEIPGLDDYLIPREIVLANYHQEDALEPGYSPNVDEAQRESSNRIRPANKFQKYKALMTRLFKNWIDRKPEAGIRTPPADGDISVSLRTPSADWRAGYQKGQDAIRDIHLPRELLYRSTLSDLLNDLATAIDRRDNIDQSNDTEPGKLPRLALVLSGGGAKCAYQAGAIVEIENKIKEINSKRGTRRPLEIDLVVGTSGGAINALLVGLGITKTANGAAEMERLWGSFKQQQFFQPSRRFNLGFGLCFGLLQALLITVAVLLFGRQSMNWIATILVLAGIGIVEVVVCRYFGVRWRTIGLLLGAEGALVGLMIVIVLVVGLVIDASLRWWKRKHRSSVTSEAELGGAEQVATPRPVETNQQHWRWLTVVLMLVFSVLEVVIAKAPGLDARVSGSSDNHWICHIWMLVTLVCNWSFPYPLAIGILMTLVGGVIWKSFDWNQRRETFVWWMAIVLIAVSAGLVLEVVFRENSPSKAQGIEDAFAQHIPELIQRTVKPDFQPSPPREGETALQSISRQLMDENAPILMRDLVITTSRLPMNANAPDGINEEDAQLVNTLPDDLYFYFRHNRDETLKPPLDKRLIPLKRNPDKLLDVVIGSSTIYPIFPSRILMNVTLGGEEMQSPKPVKKMKIIDGGFIHNIPIQAAGLWKASHIILIEASPLRPQSEPRHLWDNTMMAFGYLFSQAQRSDKLARGTAETFELRPTSRCEKLNTIPVCTDRDNIPEPDMDTFDFSNELVMSAFQMGRDDVLGRDRQDANSETPLFVRVPGPPLFRSISPVSARYLFRLGSGK